MAQEAKPGPVTLHPHWGHFQVRHALARARSRGSLPSSVLIHGDPGVGKQHLALWLGRLLLCRNPGQEGPCDSCPECRMALRLEHPDLHWFFPLPRPKAASSPQKLSRALEEARADSLQDFRENPLRPTYVEESRTLYLAAAQALRRQALKRPSQAQRQVFIIAEAEALSPGDSSSEAANALLKLLEEPPADTFLLLTSGEPGRLLPTIRSRTTPLHLPPLSREEVAAFLVEVAGAEEDEAQRASLLAKGSVGKALGYLPSGGGKGPLEAVRAEGFRLLSAALAPNPHQVFQAASELRPVGARGMSQLLDSVQEWLRDLALAASGSFEEVRNRDEVDFFHEILARAEVQPVAVAGATQRVDEARQLAAGNVNPQLIIFGLLSELREAILHTGVSPEPPG